MKILSAIQPSFIPWRGYFDIIDKSNVFVFYDHVQYDKNGWRTRNRIIINDKPSWITLPIKHQRLNKKIKDVQLFEPDKNLKKIINTLSFNYKKHPGFNKFFKILEKTLDKHWINLSDLNIELVKTICNFLKIPLNYKLSSNLNNIDDRNLNLIEICKMFNCDHYLSGKLAKNYIDENLFIKNNIKVVWHEYKEIPYRHFNLDKNIFYEKMSIIDYIFNLQND